MAKKLEIEGLRITKNRTLEVQYNKLSSDGDFIGYHRTTVEAKEDIKAQLDAVHTHMSKEGYEPCPEDELALAHDMAALAWSDKYLNELALAGIEKRKALRETEILQAKELQS